MSNDTSEKLVVKTVISTSVWQRLFYVRLKQADIKKSWGEPSGAETSAFTRTLKFASANSALIAASKPRLLSKLSTLLQNGQIFCFC